MFDMILTTNNDNLPQQYWLIRLYSVIRECKNWILYIIYDNVEIKKEIIWRKLGKMSSQNCVFQWHGCHLFFHKRKADRRWITW